MTLRISRLSSRAARPPSPPRPTTFWAVIRSSPARAVASKTFNLTNTGTPFAALIVNTTSDALAPGGWPLEPARGHRFQQHRSRGKRADHLRRHRVQHAAKTITLTGFQLEMSNTIGTVTITGPAAGVTVSGGGLAACSRSMSWSPRPSRG